MHVFVSEYLTCGAAPLDLAPSLAAEGRSMVEAIITDFARVPGWEVLTTWSARLDPPRIGGWPVVCVTVGDREQERDVFSTLAARADATLVIAPEFHGILLERFRLVQAAGGQWVGCAADAIALCADKLRLAGHLTARGVRTIETWPLPIADLPGEAPPASFEALSDLVATVSPPVPAGGGRGAFGGSLVVKPRDGAGSQLTRRVSTNAELAAVRRLFLDSDFRDRAIVQPCVSGRAVSVAVLIPPDGGRSPEVLPFAEQHLSTDGRFEYVGGRVRFPPDEPEQSAIAALARAACEAVPGLAGYVGFDVIVPDEDPAAPVLVEINARLTTSYLGYQQLSRVNLAERLVCAPGPLPPLAWTEGTISFRTCPRLATGKGRQSRLEK